DVTPNHTTTVEYSGITVDPRDDAHVLASVYQHGKGCAIFASTSSGDAWTQLQSVVSPDVAWWTPTMFSAATAAIAFDPIVAKRAYLTDWNGVYVKNDVTTTKVAWTTHERGHEEMGAMVLRSPTAGPILLCGVPDHS